MRTVALIQQPVPINGGKIENPSDLIPTQTLTGFEWALVLGAFGFAVMVAVTAVGYLIRRLVNSVDKLDKTLESLQINLVENYVKKTDYGKDQEDVWEEIGKRVTHRECGMESCPPTHRPWTSG